VPTPEPTPAPTPNVLVGDTIIITINQQSEAIEMQENITVNLDVIKITLPVALIESLVDEDGNVEDLHLQVVVSQPNANEGLPAYVELGLTRGNEDIVETDISFIVEVDLSGMVTEGMNTNRIVAVLECGTMVGGRFNPETGMFVLETQTIGSFVIDYVANLLRIGLQIGSYDVYCLVNDVRLLVMEDMTPTIQNNRTLVPLRIVAYALDADVDWNRSTRVVTITRADGQTLSFAIGEMVSGMDVPAQILNNRTRVPLGLWLSSLMLLLSGSERLGVLRLFDNPGEAILSKVLPNTEIIR